MTWQRAAAALAILAVLGVCGCDDGTTYDNSCPRINHVGDAEWQEGALVLGIWLQDLEEDSVDLVVENGGAVVEGISGHGVVGLTSSTSYPGAVHVLVFPDGSVSPGDELTFVPEDLDGCPGEPATFVVPAK